MSDNSNRDNRDYGDGFGKSEPSRRRAAHTRATRSRKEPKPAGKAKLVICVVASVLAIGALVTAVVFSIRGCAPKTDPTAATKSEKTTSAPTEVPTYAEDDYDEGYYYEDDYDSDSSYDGGSYSEAEPDPEPEQEEIQDTEPEYIPEEETEPEPEPETVPEAEYDDEDTVSEEDELPYIVEPTFAPGEEP